MRSIPLAPLAPLTSRTHAALRGLLAASLAAVPGSAQLLGGPEMPPVEWEQRLGEELPLDATFRRHDGAEVRLGELFGERPVVLALVYYECPMLCNLVLEGLVAGLRDVAFDAGDQYSVVALSIDPGETSDLAEAKRGAYLEAYGRDGAADDWTFLVGDQEDIRRVADAVGFQYTYITETDEYAHAAGVTIVTPDGAVSSVLFGASFEPRDLRLALVEAADGKIGSPVDQFLLRCFLYDPTRGKYGFAIMSTLRTAGLATAGIVLLVVLRQILRERRSGLRPRTAS